MKRILISDKRDNAMTELFAAQVVEVRAVGQTMPDKFKRSNDELMRLARAVAPDPSIFDEAAPYFMCSRISTKSLDAYFTRMHESTLRNFAVEAAEGRALLLGHDDENSNGLPVGYSLTGDYDGISGEEGAVYSYAYILPGTSEADLLIRACKAGTVRDVSVGFFGGKHICSICNKDLWRSGECPHWPGRYYPIEDPNASEGIERQTTEQLCYAWIHDAHLSEYSAVYDGATPGAVILKAQRMIAEGQLDAMTVQMLNQRYRGLKLQLPAHRLRSDVAPDPSNERMVTTCGIGASVKVKPGREHDEMTRGAVGTVKLISTEALGIQFDGMDGIHKWYVDEELEELSANSDRDTALPKEQRYMASEKGNGNGNPAGKPESERAANFEQAAEAVRSLCDLLKVTDAEVVNAVRDLQSKVSGLETDAEYGRRYREEIYADAIREGIRAKGDKFNSNEWRARFDALSFDEVLNLRAAWKEAADLVLPKGRQTQETAERGNDPDSSPAAPAMPVGAFRV